MEEMIMKVTYNEIINFVKTYYEDKDIMHNMWHIELVKKKNRLVLNTPSN